MCRQNLGFVRNLQRFESGILQRYVQGLKSGLVLVLSLCVSCCFDQGVGVESVLKVAGPRLGVPSTPTTNVN